MSAPGTPLTMILRSVVVTVLATTVVVTTAATARTFKGYALNDANAAAISVKISDLYKFNEALNVVCEHGVVESLQECTNVLALGLESPLKPENINSPHYPGGCFITIDSRTDEMGGFFNFHANANNTEGLEYYSVCRTGASLSDTALGSWCDTTTSEVGQSSSVEECGTTCVASSSCKGVSFDRTTSTCNHLSTATYTFVANATDEVVCVRTSSCIRTDPAVVSEIVELSDCYKNPRLNQQLAEQESCFDVGCAATGTFCVWCRCLFAGCMAAN